MPPGDPTPGAFLRPDDDALAPHAGVYGTDPGQRALGLARALVTSPGWHRIRAGARLCVRTEPRPLLAVLGSRGTDDELLRALGWQVRDSIARLRPVAYPEVERVCGVLADRLRDRVGPDVLRRARVVAVPRGGLLVTGLLAYLLDLDHAQLEPGGHADGPLLVVDDCMLSGSRARRWLRTHDGGDVILAHLHSHPDLRRALERDEPRVAACVAGADIEDHAPRLWGEEYGAWRRRWEARSPEDYWIGHPDHVCYPWNEPDTRIWDPHTERAEAGWRVVPPDWCVKNRAEGASVLDDVQRCEPAPGPLQPGPEVLWATMEDTVVVADGAGGASVRLSGVSADLWRALMVHADPAPAADAVAAEYGVEVGRVRDDLASFCETLVTRGLLEHGRTAS
jgi:hypothetical protein